MNTDFKTLVAQFETAVVAFQQYDAFLEQRESWISVSQNEKLNKLEDMVNRARKALLNYYEETL